MSNRITDTENGHRGSREVERDIARTRGEMDRTLDELGQRLHPQQLMHQVLDLFRSDDSHPNEWAIEARRGGKRLARRIKRNPVPALLIGAGAAWYWMQDEEESDRRRDIHQQWDVPERSGSAIDARTGEPYDDDYGSQTNIAPAWHAEYDWEDAHYDEDTWTPKAEATITEMQTTAGDASRPVHDRLNLVAGKLARISGLKRSEMQRALRSQWDDLPEHSGSFVDARTGQPYEDSYGERWQQLAAIDVFSSPDIAEHEEDEGWRERAEQTLKSVQESLNDTSKSVKDRLNAAGSQMAKLASGSRSYAKKYGEASRRRSRSMMRGTRRGMQRMGHQVGSGYESTRDYVAETMEENPLAMGIGVLGLGLLVGAMLPPSRREDEMMGEQSDEVKHRGAEAGREAMERGQHIAQSAGEAAYDEAERQGLTPAQLAEQTRKGVEKVADTAKSQTASASDVRSRAESVAQRATEAAKEEMHDQKPSAKETSSSR